MRKIYILGTIFIVVVMIFAVSNLWFKPTKNAENLAPQITVNTENTNPEIKTNDKNDPPAQSTKYTVKSKENEIYVYNSQNKIVSKLDIDYNSLRKYDREQFDRGIVVENFEEIYHIVEDFTG